MAFRSQMRTVFVHGFAKSERGNIGTAELGFWRAVAGGLLALNGEKLAALIEAREIAEIDCDDERQVP